MATKNGGPAFPTISYEHGGEQDGMTLRDYFAAKALQGMLAFYGNPSHRYDELAMQAYTFAEAMIDEREKR